MQITRIIPRRGVNDEGRGKKYALLRLISSAETPYVWLQDDDIQSPYWEQAAHGNDVADMPIDEALSQTEYADLYILPLRMEGGNSLLERLQRAEYAAIQQLTILAAQWGHPVMCSAANMIVRRERWLESYPELHPDIASGDDMFLLESFKRRGLKIRVLDDACYDAIVTPIREWKPFLKQRMRWAGKSPRYRDRDILCCGAVVLFANLLQILCPLVLLLKFPVDYYLIKKRDNKVSLLDALLLEICYPWYILLSLLGGIFSLRKSSPSF